MRHAALQPSEPAQVLAAPARRIAVQVVADRRPHLGRRVVVPLGIERLERRGHDADDAVLAIAHDQRAPDDRRIGAETAPPQLVAEEQHPPVIRTVVLGGEAASERRTDAHHVEVVPAHADGRHPLRLAARDQRRHPRAHHRELLEAAAPLAPVEHGREADVAREPLGVAIADGHEPLGIRIRQRAQEDGVDHGEDGGVGADAERQRDQRRGGEAGRAPQHAEAVAQVLPQHLEKRQAALIAPGLGNLRVAAELEPRGAPRRGGIEAARSVTLLEHLEMEAQLLAQLGRRARPIPKAPAARATSSRSLMAVPRSAAPRPAGAP